MKNDKNTYLYTSDIEYIIHTFHNNYEYDSLACFPGVAGYALETTATSLFRVLYVGFES